MMASSSLPVFSFGFLYCQMKQQVMTTESRKKTIMPNMVHFTFIFFNGSYRQQAKPIKKLYKCFSDFFFFLSDIDSNIKPIAQMHASMFHAIWKFSLMSFLCCHIKMSLNMSCIRDWLAYQWSEKTPSSEAPHYLYDILHHQTRNIHQLFSLRYTEEKSARPLDPLLLMSSYWPSTTCT